MLTQGAKAVIHIDRLGTESYRLAKVLTVVTVLHVSSKTQSLSPNPIGNETGFVKVIFRFRTPGFRAVTPSLHGPRMPAQGSAAG